MRPLERLTLATRAVVAGAILAPLVLVLLALAVLIGASLGVGVATLGGLVDEPDLLVVIGGCTAGVGISLVKGVKAVKSGLRAGKRRWIDGTVPADSDEYPALNATVGRLCRQADVPRPELRIHPTDAVLCYTVATKHGRTVVVSSGLLTRLSEDEVTAVLAHEIAHLANGDHRWMMLAVLPLLAAEEFGNWIERMSGQGRAWYNQRPLILITGVLIELVLSVWATLGMGVFSRGREYAADSGAVALTGNPAALASALERLGHQRGTPDTDLRAHATSTDALNVLPTLHPDADGGLLGTHPPTYKRIRRLRAMVREQET